MNAHTRARTTDPSTSHEAASSAHSLSELHFGIIVLALKEGPGTIYQLSDRTGLSHIQIARRLPEMEKLGTAQPTGETAMGPTGRQCRVWASK